MGDFGYGTSLLKTKSSALGQLFKCTSKDELEKDRNVLR